jgi:hypothetical protein
LTFSLHIARTQTNKLGLLQDWIVPTSRTKCRISWSSYQDSRSPLVFYSAINFLQYPILVNWCPERCKTPLLHEPRLTLQLSLMQVQFQICSGQQAGRTLCFLDDPWKGNNKIPFQLFLNLTDQFLIIFLVKPDDHHEYDIVRIPMAKFQQLCSIFFPPLFLQISCSLFLSLLRPSWQSKRCLSLYRIPSTSAS